MSEISGQTGSSLAIVEKRPQRPGGCVGIFFQLFDWNRRLAKKKLFSKKLLPPVRVRKTSKKFTGDEKLPKHRLIADENSEGFPHGKKSNGGVTVDTEQKNEIRTPGLVARLMGLESMPAARQNQEKNGSSSGAVGDKGDKFINGKARIGRAELNVEIGETKQELRPPKLQKTGLSEKRPVTRFGAEALQLKNVLSRSRKHHQKLIPPVKSPRNVSGKNASRLFGAATRILEPGLQRSRSNCSLTYSNEYHPPSKVEVLTEEAKDLKPLENSFYFQSSAQTLNEQSSSCRNCGHLLDITDIRPNIEEQPPISLSSSQIMHPSAQVSEMGNPRLPMFCPQMGNKVDPQYHAVFGMEARQVSTDYVPDKKFLNRECQRHWQPTSQQFKLQKDSSSVCSRHKVHGQNQISQGRERLPSRSKISRLQSCRASSASNAINETKDFAVLNQNTSDTTRLRMPVRVDSYWLDTDRKIVDRRHDSLSPVRKRRSANNSRQNDAPCFVRSSTKPTNNRSNATSGKDRGCSSHSAQGLTHLQESVSGDNGKNDTDVISFTFKSPMKRKTGIRADVEVRRNQDGQNGEAAYKRTPSNALEGKSSLKTLPLSGDSLGVLLEQKLKELTCQEEDDSAFGDTTPKKTTAMILQELISALTSERPGDLPHGENKSGSHFCVDQMIQQSKRNASTIFQAKQKSKNNSAGNLPTSEHLSPGSVLEASFSNDSCGSSSIDDGSRCNMGTDSTEFCEEPKLLESDADLSDSASWLGMGKFYRDSVINLLNNISEVFGALNLGDANLKGSKLTHANEVILNAELVFGNAALPVGVVNGGFSISNFALNQLDLLASVMWRNFSAFVVFDTKEGNHLKGFVFDCFIEYLESRFSRYSNSGFNAWTRLPLRMKTEMLICEIVEEVGRWAALAGLFPDELIEHEMSHSLGKWTDFELDAFETGIEMEQQILQALISEMLLDFTDCNPECC